MPDLNPFSDANLKTAVQPLATQPHNEFDAGVVVDPTNGVVAEAVGNEQIGKGWALNEKASWYTRTKTWAVAAWVTWRKGSS